MEKIISFSIVVIAALSYIVIGSIAIIKSTAQEKGKVATLAILHSLVYCLLQYACGFIQWTIKLDKFDQYPYRNPFCMLVIIYCIITFIIIGTYYIKYGKNKYGVPTAVWLWIAIQIASLFLILFFSPFNGWF